MEEERFVTDTLSMGESKFMVGIHPCDLYTVLLCLSLSLSLFKGVCVLPAPLSDDGGSVTYRRIDIRLIPMDQYYFGTLYFTGIVYV